MLDNYLEEQYVSTKLLKKELNNGKLVQAYLFYYEDINYLLKYAINFSEEIICGGKKNEKIINDIAKGTYSELKIISPEGNFIKKEQLINLQNSIMNKPVLGAKIVYIIKECDKLNASSANSMLKFLEEPSDDIVAILLTDNINNVMPTIVSRCQIINLNKVKDNETSLVNEKINKLLNKDNIDYEEFCNIIENCIDFVQNIEKKKINFLIYVKKYLWEKYTDSKYTLAFLNILIYFYMDILYLKSDNEIRYFYDNKDLLNEISKLNNIEQLTKKIYLLESIKNEIKYNVNTKLIFDKLIIELGDI